MMWTRMRIASGAVAAPKWRGISLWRTGGGGGGGGPGVRQLTLWQPSVGTAPLARFASSSSSSSSSSSAADSGKTGADDDDDKYDNDNDDNDDDDYIPASIWDKPDLRRIFDNNRSWRKSMMEADPDIFRKMKEGQAPEFLLIGCADSRVGAQELMGLRQGELFVHRNIANCVVSTDLNMLSVLFYAVNVLRVKEIIVLGHYECGGVKAATQNQDLGLIEHWLRNIRDVQRLHSQTLSQIKDDDARFRRLVELNVQEQCINLFSNSIVQQMQAKTGRPRIHGMVYDIGNGRLKYLDVDFKSEVRKYRNIYTVADFRHYAPVNIRDVTWEGGKVKDGETDRRALAQLLFRAMDTQQTGSIGREELRQAMKKFAHVKVTEQDLDEALKPLQDASQSDSVDLETFETILESMRGATDSGAAGTTTTTATTATTTTTSEAAMAQHAETDRLVVIRRVGAEEYAPRPLRCRASTTILELKQAIKNLTSLPVEHQALYYKGRLLRQDSAILAEVGIDDISEVELKEEITPFRK